MSYHYAQTSFTGGEWSPRLNGQFDQKKYFTAAAILQNLVIQTHGPITRRPGTRFVAEVKDSSLPVKLIPFEFSSVQAYMLEFGEYYIRIYKDQGQILDGGIPYEIVSPYSSADLPGIWFIQSADTMFLVHPNHSPRKLTRTGNTAWAINEIDFTDGPYLTQNTTGITLQPSGTTGSIILTAVPVVGAEKVVNGNFDIGPEKVVDGDFAVAGSWIYGANWSFDAAGLEADHAAVAANNLELNISAVAAETYALSYEIKNRTGGSITPSIGGAAGVANNANGIKQEYITATGTGNLIFAADASFDGSIDNVSVKRVVDTAWTWGANWVHDGFNYQADHTPGSVAALEQNITVTSGLTYLVVFTITNRTAGSVVPSLGGVNGPTRSADGTYSQTIAASTTENLKFTSTTTFDGSIDVVSVKESSGTTDIFQAGHIGSCWRLKESTWGYVEITGITDNLHATALVRKTLDGVNAVTTWREGAWSGVRGYPTCCTFHEERLIFAGTSDQPQTFWGSVSGDFENFTPEDTITDAGPFTYTLASDQVNVIRWLSSSRLLMGGTMSGEWKISASNPSSPITPTDIAARKDTSYGSSGVKPISVGNVVLFVQGQGRKVRELAYSYADDSYVAPDMSLISEHITAPSITEIAYQREPDQTVWVIRSDGVLLSMVYERPQEVVGWSKHVTDGLWESVAVIPGTTQDEIWLVANRTIGGATKRYVELMQPVSWGVDQEDCFFVDCGLTYDPVIPAAVTTVSGLDHLEGKTVQILADGGVVPSQVVVGGDIILTTEANVVQVGLPYTPQFKNLPPEIPTQSGTSQGLIKRIDRITLRLRDTLGLQIGKDVDSLVDQPFRHVADLMGEPRPLFTGDLTVEYPGEYEKTGQFILQQNTPTPFTLQAIIMELSI